MWAIRIALEELIQSSQGSPHWFKYPPLVSAYYPNNQDIIHYVLTIAITWDHYYKRTKYFQKHWWLES